MSFPAEPLPEPLPAPEQHRSKRSQLLIVFSSVTLIVLAMACAGVVAIREIAPRLLATVATTPSAAASTAQPSPTPSPTFTTRVGDVTTERGRVLREQIQTVMTEQGNWWLIEGIAELAEHPAALDVTSWRSATLSYIRNGWNRKLPTSGPPIKASVSSVGAQYGVAYLAVKRLEVRFGRAKLLEFYYQVVENKLSFDAASTVAFGKSWADVQKDCINYIRNY